MNQINKHFDIAFVFPPGGEMLNFMHHLGVSYIQAYLLKKGIYSIQICPKLGGNISECADEILSTGANIVGFTCFDYNFHLVKGLVKYLKERHNDLIILAGGPSATFSDELLLNKIPGLDACVRFEGEITTHKLYEKIQNGIPLDRLDSIDGISFRREKKIIKTKDRPLLFENCNRNESLDELPSPYINGVLNGTEGIGVLTARGCIHNCTYCNFSAMSKKKIRYHSVNRVIKELQIIESALLNLNTDHKKTQIIPIHDDAFSININRAKEICKRIIELNINLNLACLCRADNLDEELILLMKEAGFNEISLGLESGVPRILYNIKKIPQKKLHNKENVAFSNEKTFLLNVKKVISTAKKHNMRTSVSVILGLPGETQKEGQATIDFVRDLDVNYYSHNFLTLFPGTELFNSAHNFGIKRKKSKFQLPYETQFAYDVSRVPFDVNSSAFRNGRTLERSFLNAISGANSVRNKGGTGIHYVIIKTDDFFPFESIYFWLAKYLSIGGNVLVIINSDNSKEVFNRSQEANAATELPTECRYFTVGSNSNYNVFYEAYLSKYMKWPFRNPQIDFKDVYSYVTNESYSINHHEVPIFCVRDEKDLRMLCAISDISKGKKNNIPDSRIWFNGVFLDGCRWSREQCPAISLSNIVIDEDMNIQSCLTGSKIGTIDSTHYDLRNKTKEIYGSIVKRRKCYNCSVSKWCSQCLFTHPFSEEEFCAVQKSQYGIGGIIARSKMFNAIHPFNDEEW